MSAVATIPVDIARQRAVVSELAAFLPERALLYEREDVQPYECDGLSAYRQLPMVVALPETEQGRVEELVGLRRDLAAVRARDERTAAERRNRRPGSSHPSPCDLLRR